MKGREGFVLLPLDAIKCPPGTAFHSLPFFSHHIHQVWVTFFSSHPPGPRAAPVFSDLVRAFRRRRGVGCGIVPDFLIPPLSLKVPYLVPLCPFFLSFAMLFPSSPVRQLCTCGPRSIPFPPAMPHASLVPSRFHFYCTSSFPAF